MGGEGGELPPKVDEEAALQVGRVDALWPGDCRPQCRMAVLSRMAKIAARDGRLDCIPVLFERCTALLDPIDERAAVSPQDA